MKTNGKMEAKWYAELRNVTTGISMTAKHGIIKISRRVELNWKKISAERTEKGSTANVVNVRVTERPGAFGSSLNSFLTTLKSVYAISLISLAAISVLSCSDESLTPSEDPTTSAFSAHDQTVSSAISTLVPYTYESLSNGTVKLRFENLSGQTINGDLIREGVSYQQNGTILTEFTVADGSTHSFIDDHVIPGETYRYIFEYTTAGVSEYIINFDTVTVVSTIPALGNFLLLPPYGGEAYDFLFDNQTIAIARTNITVETDHDLTRSVVFILNDEEHIDNSAPFTLFPGRSANLENGSYMLTAIAYPRKNGKGVAGDTTVVFFTVNNLY